MKKQIRSFGCAVRGFIGAVRDEAHLRFHLIAAAYVFVFSLFYHFSAVQYAVLIILVACVIGAELFNTALENACDAVTTENNVFIKRAKDISAGAVLAFAIAAVAVAVIFFWDIETIKSIFDYFARNIIMLIVLIISAVLSVLFVKFGFGRKNR